MNKLCNVENSCLIIVDIQAKLTAAMPDKVISRLRKNTEILIDAANQLNVPIITTAQYPKGLGPIEEFISNRVSDSAKNFDKTCFSSLGADQFTEHLNQINKKQIILLGIEAHICVLQSAIELLDEGYDVFVVTDAIASRKLTSYDTALIRLNQAGCSLLNTESVLFEWLRDASHPEFKTLSKLIL
ncbi:MAG: hydrolase [Pseudomonadota bacterium]